MLSKLTIKKLQLAKLQQYMAEIPAMKKNLPALQKLLRLRREIVEIQRCNGLISSKEAKKLTDDLMRQFAVNILCLDLGV